MWVVGRETECLRYSTDGSAKKMTDRQTMLEGKFLYEQVDILIHLKALKIVSITLKPHQQTSIRYIS